MKELITAMINFKKDVGIIVKDCKGQTGNRTFDYADLATFDDAITEAMFKHKLWVNQYLQQHGDKTHLHSNLYHESGQHIESDCALDYVGKDIKEFGGVISYYRRYALQTILNLVTDKAENVIKNAEDLPPNTLTRKEQIDNFVSEEDGYKSLFAFHKGKFTLEVMKEFFNDRVKLNKRTVLQNIQDFSKNPDALAKEMKSWEEWKKNN